MCYLCALLFLLPSLAFPDSAGGLSEVAGFDLEVLVRVLTFQDYNTRVVVIGTTLLGIAGGLVGTFMLLRKRALLSDAVSHATLPGVAAAFMVIALTGGTGKSLPVLLAGAAISGTLGMLAVALIRNHTRLKDDAALGIVLSVMFGLGISLLGIIQKMETGSAAGLTSFIYGKTASMLFADALIIAVAAAVILATCLLFFKEFGILCFDQEYAGSIGLRVGLLDLLMMSLVVMVTVIGLQAVGLILVIAILIIPAAAARFWTERLAPMLWAAGALGGLSGFFGSALSALIPRLPAGAIIVLVATFFFTVSLLIGARRGALLRLMEHLRLTRRVARQHLLRALYEAGEHESEISRAEVPFRTLLRRRSWTESELRKVLRRARRNDLVEPAGDDRWRLTQYGAKEAFRVVRNHRLWEMYLITYADIAPSHVDRDADMIEHILGAELVKELEKRLEARGISEPMPPSPHSLEESPVGA